MSIAKRLSETLGGDWKYDGRGQWWCNDEIRHVARCCSGINDTGDPIGREYWLYGDGIPERAEKYFNMENITFIF